MPSNNSRARKKAKLAHSQAHGAHSQTQAQTQAQAQVRKHDKEELSQAEIWDDSALVRSWDEAVKEYEFYHSIHARGENVEEVLRRAALAESGENGGANDDGDDDGEIEEGELYGDDDDAAEVEEGESEDKQEIEDPGLLGQGPPGVVEGEENASSGATAKLPGLQDPGRSSNSMGGAKGPTKVAPTTTTTTTDQTLENLKMAYWWAGYYSGLYEGQRQADEAAAASTATSNR